MREPRATVNGKNCATQMQRSRGVPRLLATKQSIRVAQLQRTTKKRMVPVVENVNGLVLDASVL